MLDVKKDINQLLQDTRQIAGHINQADEYVAVKEVELAIEKVREAINNLELTIHEARKVFERARNEETEIQI